MNHLFEGSDAVYRYTRKQAIEDGVLVDISQIAREAGIKYPVAVTQSVYQILNNTSSEGQDFAGRSWDMLMIFRMFAKTVSSDVIHFAPLFIMEEEGKPVPVRMWAKCGPGDEGEPVITIMLEGED